MVIIAISNIEEATKDGRTDASFSGRFIFISSKEDFRE